MGFELLRRKMAVWTVCSCWLVLLVVGVARGDMGNMAYPGRNGKNYFHYFRFPRFYAGCRAKKPENRPRTAPRIGNAGNKPSYGVTHWFLMHWVKVTEVTLF
jgi:hypothetical protein